MSAPARPADQPLRIVVADDQASVREGLVLLLDGLPDIEVVGAAANGEQALDLVAAQQPDAILLDLHMPVLDGIGATRRLAAEHPGVAIVILTTYADDGSVLQALQAGARSYLTKDADRTDIARALHAAAGGLSVLGSQVQAALLAAMTPAAPGTAAPGTAAPRTAAPPPGAEPAAPAPPPDGLTQREAEILGLIARGLTNPEIAARLFLSNHTIKTHISRIFAKTGSRDRAAAIGYAHRHNIG
jgi:DNA-binding NarL/FixJ family response regulator